MVKYVYNSEQVKVKKKKPKYHVGSEHSVLCNAKIDKLNSVSNDKPKGYAGCKTCLKISKDKAKLRKVLKKRTKQKKAVDTASAEFLISYEWRKLRYKALLEYGEKCMCCNAKKSDGVRIYVDHIKPRKKYPELALDINNLQILCEECNHGKGNWDETDWRNIHSSSFY